MFGRSKKKDGKKEEGEYFNSRFFLGQKDFPSK
jgi:hypothetical protein